MSPEEKKFNPRLLGEIFRNAARLYKIIWPEKKLSVILVFLSVLISASGEFLKAGALALLVNYLVAGKDIGQILFITGAAVVAVFLPLIFIEVERYLGAVIYLYLEAKFDILIQEKKGSLDIAAHEDPSLKDLIVKVVENGVWRIQGFIDRWFYSVQSFAQLAIAAATLIWLNPLILVVVAGASLPALWVELRYGGAVWGIQSENSERRRRYWDARNLFDDKETVSELRLFQSARFFVGLIKKIYRTWQEDRRRAEKQRFIWRLFAQLLEITAVGWSLLTLVRGAMVGEIQIGTLLFALSTVFIFQRAITDFFSLLSRQYQDSLFVTDVFKFLSIKSRLKKPKNGFVLSRRSAPEIVFDNVSFAYPQTPDKEIIKNFSFSIAPGEKLAIVGVNGAGKTTLVKLLCRFYDPTAGRILINGRDLREIDLNSWYSSLGVIFQDYSKYFFQAQEVIGLGRFEKKRQFRNVVAAAKKSESDSFIREWEKNYDQMLGSHYPGGLDPSVGQWQKLALARTFYREPLVYILDEPTSSIDAEAEEKIFERLESVTGDKTVILISHRFSTVRRADKIMVIEEGDISEYGAHEELLAEKGTYEHLFRLQAKGYV